MGYAKESGTVLSQQGCRRVNGSVVLNHTEPAILDRIIGEETVALATIALNPRNVVKQHPERQLQAIEAAFREFGILKPLIINTRTGYLIDGHARVTVARRLGLFLHGATTSWE